MTHVARTPLTPSLSERAAATLLLGHVVLLCCGGQAYAKLHAFGPFFVTDVVLLVTAVLGVRAIAAVPWDRLTNLVALFVAFGVCWAVVGGVGDLRGAGAKALSFFVYAAFYFIVRGLVRDDDARWRLLHGIALTAIAGALLGIAQTRAGAPLLDPSARFEVTTTGSTRWLNGEYAIYAVVAASVPAVAAVITRRISRTSMVLLLAAAIELVLVQHRSGFVALAIALFATSSLVVGSGQSARGLLKLVGIVALAVGLYVLLFGSSYIDETAARLRHTTDFEDGNVDWRLHAWSEVLAEVVTQPFGHGFATWDFWFTMPNPLTGSHNDYLDLAYRIGVPGLVAFVALPVALVRQTRALVQRTGPLAQRLPTTACAGVLAFLVFAAFNVVLESPQVSILFWVLLGVGGGALHDHRQQLAGASNGACT